MVFIFAVLKKRERGQIFGIDKLDGGEECRTSINK